MRPEAIVEVEAAREDSDSLATVAWHIVTAAPRSANGQNAKGSRRANLVRSCSNTRHYSDVTAGRLSANSGLAQPGRRWNPEWVIVRLYWVRSLMMGVAVCSACS